MEPCGGPILDINHTLIMSPILALAYILFVIQFLLKCFHIVCQYNLAAVTVLKSRYYMYSQKIKTKSDIEADLLIHFRII